MSAIAPAQALEEITTQYQAFAAVLANSIEDCGDEAGTQLAWGYFADDLVDRYCAGRAPEAPQVLGCVERYINDGTQQTMDVVATLFLETLENAILEGPEQAMELTQHLGRRSVAYLKTWAEANGNPSDHLSDV